MTYLIEISSVAEAEADTCIPAIISDDITRESKGVV